MNRIIRLPLFLLLGLMLLFSTPCYSLIIDTQADIDSFSINYPGWVVIDEPLILSGEDIVNFDGLNHLESIRILQVANCPNIVSLTGFGSLHTIVDDLVISNNQQLESISAFENLEIIADVFLISSLPSLVSIEGFDNIITIGNLNILNNESVQLISAFYKLEHVIGSFVLINNPNLSDINPLENLIQIEGGLIVQSIAISDSRIFSSLETVSIGVQFVMNPNLKDLSGLENLSNIGVGGLSILENTSLENILALDNLTDANGGFLNIRQNSILTSLEGLENLDLSGFVNNTISIENNPNLSICNLPNFCDYINQGFAISYFGNNEPCESYDTVEASCISSNTNTDQEKGVRIYPNPIKDRFSISSAYPVTSIIIVDSQGRRWTKKPRRSFIDMGSFAPGLYHLIIIHDHGITQESILKI